MHFGFRTAQVRPELAIWAMTGGAGRV
jgi:hypothetical protein